MKSIAKICFVIGTLISFPVSAQDATPVAEEIPGYITIEDFGNYNKEKNDSPVICKTQGQYDVKLTYSEAFAILKNPKNSLPQALRLALQSLNESPIRNPGGSFSQFSFWNADLSDIHVFAPNLVSSYFSGTNFKESNMPYANFCSSVLQLADLSNSGLVLVDFSKAYLLRTNFTGANLYKAVFKEANISGANFTGVTQLTQAQIDEACYKPIHGAPTLPPGFSLPPSC